MFRQKILSHQWLQLSKQHIGIEYEKISDGQMSFIETRTATTIQCLNPKNFLNFQLRSSKDHHCVVEVNGTIAIHDGIQRHLMPMWYAFYFIIAHPAHPHTHTQTSRPGMEHDKASIGGME